MPSVLGCHGLEVDRTGEVSIRGYRVSELAEKFGTPLYVYDEVGIRTQVFRLKNALDKFAGEGKYMLKYAVKGNPHPRIIKSIVSLGLGIDAACLDEARLGLDVGVHAKDIILSGNFLSSEELKKALELGVVINLDSVPELIKLLKHGLPEIISFRVNPGVGKSEVGHWVTNGGPDAKFGIWPDQIEYAFAIAKKVGIKRFGVHMMPGSCVRDAKYFGFITETLMDILGPVYNKLEIELEFVDVGGGLGIPYYPAGHENGKELDINEAVQNIVEALLKKCGQFGLRVPKLCLEPARYFVGGQGYLIGRITNIKSFNPKPGEERVRIIGADSGSMNILVRPGMYGAYHHILIDGREKNGCERIPTGFCGQICENTDWSVRKRDLPANIREGDVTITLCVGAYGYGMSYPYNGRNRAAQILINSKGYAEIITKAEAYETAMNLHKF